MDPEANILIRQILAGVLFTLGLVWAVMAGAVFADALTGALTKIGPILYWTVGSAIWVSWGLIAFTNIRRKKELTAWIVSALFHAATLAPFIVRSDVSWRLDRLMVIPLWWIAVVLVSVAAIVLTLKNGEERA
jgi:uncharacterized membrane protein